MGSQSLTYVERIRCWLTVLVAAGVRESTEWDCELTWAAVRKRPTHWTAGRRAQISESGRQVIGVWSRSLIACIASMHSFLALVTLHRASVDQQPITGDGSSSDLSLCLQATTVTDRQAGHYCPTFNRCVMILSIASYTRLCVVCWSIAPGPNLQNFVKWTFGILSQFFRTSADKLSYEKFAKELRTNYERKTYDRLESCKRVTKSLRNYS